MQVANIQRDGIAQAQAQGVQTIADLHFCSGHSRNKAGFHPSLKSIKAMLFLLSHYFLYTAFLKKVLHLQCSSVASCCYSLRCAQHRLLHCLVLALHCKSLSPQISGRRYCFRDCCPARLTFCSGGGGGGRVVVLVLVVVICVVLVVD